MSSRAQSLAEKEIKELVKLGETLLRDAEEAHSELRGEPISRMTMWAAMGGQLIQRLYGKDNEYSRTFTSILKTKDFVRVHSNNCEHLAQLLGLFKAIAHEIDNDLLVDIRGLLQADVFADFLEMAEYLKSQHYKDAAAVIIGAVLEDVLRKVALKHGVATMGPQGKPLTNRTAQHNNRESRNLQSSHPAAGIHMGCAEE
jgi:hypothetical protein